MSATANDTGKTLRGQEDWDIQGHTSSLVANGGPPRVSINRSRGRGRGRGTSAGIGIPAVLPSRPAPKASLPPTVRASSGRLHKRGGRGVPDRPRERRPERPSGIGFGRGSPHRVKGGARAPPDPRRDYLYERDWGRDPRAASSYYPPSGPSAPRPYLDNRDHRGHENHAGPSRQRAWSPSEPLESIPHPSYSTTSHSSFARTSQPFVKPPTLHSHAPRETDRPTPTHTHFDPSSNPPTQTEQRPPTPPPPEPGPSLAPPAVERDTSPVIYKMKFKVNVKGKRKEQPALPAVHSGVEVQVDEKDIKPEILRAPSPEQPEEPRVDDHNAPTGDLSFRRPDIPDACYDSDSAKKTTARAAFKKIKTRDLKAQGRKVTKTRWLPDGAVFEWTLVTAPTQKVASSSVEPVGEGTETSLIPFPPGFSTSQLRKANNLLFNDWRLERQLAASALDPVGRLTIRTRSEVTPDGLSIETLPLDPKQPRFPQFDVADHKAYEKKASIRYPDRFDLVDSSNPNEAVVTWVNEQCVASALLDESGKATRFVACSLGSKKLHIVGRKTENWDDSEVKPISATPALKANGKRAADPSPSAPVPEATKRTKLNGVGSTAKPSTTTSAAVSSQQLVALNEAMDRNFEDIHTWTTMLRDYPGDERVQGQVQRIQEDIFRLQGEIKEEKQRLGVSE